MNLLINLCFIMMSGNAKDQFNTNFVYVNGNLS